MSNERDVEIMTREEAFADIEKVLKKEPLSNVLVQSRVFVDGPNAQNFYSQFSSRDSRVIVNVDANTLHNFQNSYQETHKDKPLHSIRVTHTGFMEIPFVRTFMGRNHIRLIVIGENIYLSAFDFHEYAFKRTELFTKIRQPELVQMLKVVALWDYNSKKENWQFKTKDYELVFDTGKSSRGYVSRYAEKEIAKRIKPGSQIWFSSSWYPDELTKTFGLCAKNGTEVNMLVDQRLKLGDLRHLVFAITKAFSSKIFRDSVATRSFNIFYSKNEIHSKFIMIKNADLYWWLVGTSNHTRFGSLARTSELGLAGTDLKVGEKLIESFTVEPKEKILTGSLRQSPQSP